MSEDQASYRQIFKATTLFGGVQVFNILVSIIKSKVSAIFLGPEGVGVLGLLNYTLDLVRSITGLGLNTSSVREISIAVGQGNSEKVQRTVTTLRKLCLMTGVGGMVLVIILSPWLSIWTFDSSEYTWSFVFLSIVPLMQSLSLGQLSVLQGLRKLTFLAKANLYGGAIGLIFLIPFYWLWGVKGIVPFIIISSFITLLYSFYFVRKVQIDNLVMSFKDICTAGKSMIKLGVMLTLSSFVSVFVGYLLRIYIARESSAIEVGLFTAATSIVTSYIGLVFTAMGTDFFPRLSAVCNDHYKMELMINQQAEIGVLILAPMLIFFMAFAPYLLTILYSSKFMPVTNMMRWMMLGVLLQASSWPLAFSLLAKANDKVYLLKEVASGIYYLVFSILGYKIWGLTGLGIGFVIAYVFNLIQGILINKFMYGITLSMSYLKIFLLNMMLSISAFCVVMFVPNIFLPYIWLCIIFIISLVISFILLDRKINLKNLIFKCFKKI